MEKTPNQMITELYIVTMGLADTAEKGIVGDVKDIKSELKVMNGCIKMNTAWITAGRVVVPMLAGAIGFLFGAVFL